MGSTSSWNAIAAVRSALVDGGRFAFETRDPVDRAWQRWSEEYSGEAADACGTVVRCEYRVDEPVAGGVVRTDSTFTSPGWGRPEVSRGALRFLDADELAGFLAGAGLAIEEQFGDWDEQPLTDASPEIITIARRR